MDELRIGIIGCGRIAVRHFGSAEKLAMSKIVCCCDINEEKAKLYSEKYNINYYLDYKEMLDKEQIDCVHICLPHYLHAEVSCYAFSKGVNVICEKPMSINYEDAVHAVECAKENNVLYGVIFQCRYNDTTVFVKNALDQGKLGKIISVTSTLTWSRSDDYYQGSDWKGTWEGEGGGVVIDQAIHSIDLVNYFVQSEVESLSVSLANRGHKKVTVEDSAEGLITYKNGVKYGFYCMNNNCEDEPIEIKLFCEKGKVKLTYDDAVITYKDKTEEKIHQITANEIKAEGGKEYWGYRHIKQIEQFYKACLKQEELEISGLEALKTQKLICQIYEQGKEKM